MNLERLYMENYKQFREPLELLPPEGAVGIVGRNGSGKSTLFESILWAFFGSKGGGPRFSNELIPWSGGSAKEPSTVEVTLSVGGRSFVVSRRLKGGTTTAEARDDRGKVIVSGSGDVSRFVEENLLRMDRTAFEATFFARQKELKFFAQDDGIGRVRRISKMLGISRVEDAQKLLRDDRNDLRTEARLIEGRLEEADWDGLKSGLEEARSACSRVERELERVSEEFERSKEELNTAREARSALEVEQRKHAELRQRLGEAEAEARAARERAEEAEKDLRELAEAEEELDRLKPEVARLPEVAAELERLEGERRLAEERDRLRSELVRTRRRLSDTEGEAGRLLEELDGAGETLPGWSELFDLEGAEQLEAAAAVLGEAEEVLELAERRYDDLCRLEALHEQNRRAVREYKEAEARHEEARSGLEELEDEAAGISGGSDLEEEEKRVRGEVDMLRELAAARRGAAGSDEREAQNVEKARRAIESGMDEHCPTCHRPFEGTEYDEILDTLGRQIASLNRRAAKAKAEADQHTTSATEAAARLERVSRRLSRWRLISSELVSARNTVEDRKEALRRAGERRAELEGHLNGSEPPTEGALREAREHRDATRRLRNALPVIRSLHREHGELDGGADALVVEIESLQKVSYDGDEHRARQGEKDRLERSQGRAEELERRLRTRADVEEALAAARARIEESESAAGGLRGEISALAFDEARFEGATARVLEAEERVSRLRDARERLGGEWKDADHRVGTVTTELKRLEGERKRADEKAAGAARMDEMDRLFTEFFRSLTARVRPTLEDEASALVRDLTDHRYERLEFDDNYRIKLLDRFDDAYAIERFSGGEGDVASLSARVALSKIIAARGSEALGFLVLDEVFGSLDADRRRNVMLALERLKRSFGQIFVISHVGDVQESALLDELWEIEEDEEGKSTVRLVTPAVPAELLGDLRPLG